MSGYLSEMLSHYGTETWCDSPNPGDVQRMLALGAKGVTSNPVLVGRAASGDPERWKAEIESCKADGPLLNWNLTRRIVRQVTDRLMPLYDESKGQYGIVCLQVDPRNHNNSDAMISQAKEAATLAPNIAVKLPVTKAGLVGIEELAALGISCTATVSFSVPQVIAIAEAFKRGKARAEKTGKLPTDRPLHSYAVLMVGRLDDHLRDLVKEADDRGESIGASQELLTYAGNAVGKKAYSIYKERGYESKLMIAALRGNYHIEQYVGGDLVITMPPASELEIQKAYKLQAPPRRIDEPIPQDKIDELSERFLDFRRAYAEDGMKPEEFEDFGPTRKTLNQFIGGWESLIQFVS